MPEAPFLIAPSRSQKQDKTMKTAPILLKILHNSTAKTRPNFHKTASKKNDAGFTMIELMIIVLIVGIFASIAAPSWLAFINRQRVRTVNDRVFQTLRTAQSEAKRTKSDRVVTLNTPATDPPTATIDSNPPNLNASGALQPIQTVTFDGGGEIKSGTILLASNTPSITFDYQGNVKDGLPIVAPNVRRFVATVTAVNGGGKQCAIVETIIGGMRTAEGNDCTP